MKTSISTIIATAGLAALAGLVSSSSVASVMSATNTFQDLAFTAGFQATIDHQTDIQIVDPGVELPGFAFGTYDVDFSANSISMTLINDPANLAVANYGAGTVDRYFYSFDTAIAAATLNAATNPSYLAGASLSIIEAGTSFVFDTAFVPGLPTSIELATGGVLLSLGEGTSLDAIGQQIVIDYAVVPLPATATLFVVALAGIGFAESRRKQAGTQPGRDRSET